MSQMNEFTETLFWDCLFANRTERLHLGAAAGVAHLRRRFLKAKHQIGARSRRRIVSKVSPKREKMARYEVTDNVWRVLRSLVHDHPVVQRRRVIALLLSDRENILAHCLEAQHLFLTGSDDDCFWSQLKFLTRIAVSRRRKKMVRQQRQERILPKRASMILTFLYVWRLAFRYKELDEQERQVGRQAVRRMLESGFKASALQHPVWCSIFSASYQELGLTHLNAEFADRAFELDPEKPLSHAIRAHVFFETGDFQGALSELNLACSKSTFEHEPFVQRGLLHYQLAQKDEAIRDFRHALEMAPDDPDALLGLSRAFYDIGEHREALRLTAKLVRLHPSDVEFLYEQADLYFALGYFEECCDACRRILAIDPRFADALVLLGLMAHRENRLEEATRYIEEALVYEPENIYALNEMATLLTQRGDYDRADDLVSGVLHRMPDFPDAWYHAGMIRFCRSDFEGAAHSFDRALDLQPDMLPAWLGKGNALTELQEGEQAKRCFVHVLHNDPINVEACYGLAAAFQVLGQDEDSAEWFERARSLEDNDDTT